MARLLRRKSAAVVAFGSCAMSGGIPGLANLYESRDILDLVYREAPSVQNAEGTLPAEESHVPEGELTLPSFGASVRTLDQVIDVDYYLPGCPPPTGLIASAVTALVEGKLPAKGAVLAPDVALCSECPRAATKPDKLLVQAFRRPHQALIDPGALPARARPDLPRPRYPRGLRGRLPRREHALHRLHGTHEQCHRLRGEGAVRHRVGPRRGR